MHETADLKAEKLDHNWDCYLAAKMTYSKDG